MINAFILRKWAALISVAMLSSISFFVGLVYFGLIYGIVFLLVGMILGISVASLLLRNPFTEMLEGKGILALSMDSTGIIKPFIVAVVSPFIKGKFNGQAIKDVFDRNATMQMSEPKKLKSGAYINEEGGITFNLDEKEYNKARFGLNHYPVLIWNDQIKGLITKDFLSEQEKSVFAEHSILYLNRMLEELTRITRDFARYVVELTKPQGSAWGKWWIWLIIGFALIVIIALVAPSVMNALSGTASTASGAVAAAKGGATNAPIVPVGG